VAVVCADRVTGLVRGISSFGLELSIDAQASMSAPSTLKYSELISRACCARFLENLLWSKRKSRL